ncbi:MAG: OmpA family protein [Tannerellaceae bacterium]|jgi:outer membrane protein OmpA-like peptidoglycan-associated protein|nr:OmpA family protein [Tannerellaceae bacterium]
MKTSKVVLSTLFVGLIGYASAQEFAPLDGYSTEAGYKTHFRHNKAGDNWFFSLAGGVNLFYGDRSMEAGLLNQYSFIPQVSVGKWFNPYIAFRIHVLGGPVASPLDLDGKYLQRGYFGGGHANILLDVTNLWAPYNEKRLFRLIPWLGMGYVQRFRTNLPDGTRVENGILYAGDQNTPLIPDYTVSITQNDDGTYSFPRSESPTLNAGILTAFRLTQRLDLNIEVQGALMNETFNRMAGRQLSDALIQGTVGLTWEFGKPTFEVLEPKDYAQLNDLNNRINILREENTDLLKENEKLSKRPVFCPECPPTTTTTVVVHGTHQIIHFRLNSSIVEKNQLPVLFTIAEFVNKTNSSITVTGFADRKTGSSGYNNLISEKRAKAVANVLTNKYHVAEGLVTVEWKGSEEQPYAENEWNRAVLIKVK